MLATGERVFHELRVATYNNPAARQRVNLIRLLMVQVAAKTAQHRATARVAPEDLHSNDFACIHTSCGGLYRENIHVIAREDEVVDVDQHKRHIRAITRSGLSRT